ncbi:hypothetical protein CYMTET_51917, partial [Cymbomonas tetramitiformis]
MSSSSAATCDDLLKIPEVSEDSALENIEQRFSETNIYTNVGPVLMALNPYRKLPLYTLEHLELYSTHGVNRGSGAEARESQPHIYAVAAKALRGVAMSGGNSQSVIISGESGAGKTEATKQVLRFLSHAAGGSDMEGGAGTLLQEMLHATNPVLEAFGNAKTVRNDNSSRFGKLLELQCGEGEETNALLGARITNYLLEKSRVCSVAPGERGYHIFYQLLKGASAEEREAYQLYPIEKYKYLSLGCYDIDGVDDVKEFLAVKVALLCIGITDDEQEDIFRVLSGILAMGNVEFEASDNGSELLEETAEYLQTASSCLGVELSMLMRILTTSKISVRGSVICKLLSPEKATAQRDAIAKMTYTRLFDWLVLRINQCMKSKKAWVRTINVLDIFGFENFTQNSLEQLCINYANEQLHRVFCNKIFSQEYEAEGISWERVAFPDNNAILTVLEMKMGLFPVLDEQTNFPKATDKTMLQAMHKALGHCEPPGIYKIPHASRAENGFIVNHFASPVEYTVEGFLEKNSDQLGQDVPSVMGYSSNTVIPSLFTSDGKRNSPRRSQDKQQGSKQKPTLISNFRTQLTSLIATLSGTDVHFIRCIKPNQEKKAKLFIPGIVKEQMTYSGIFAAIHVLAYGFQVQLPFDKFNQTLWLLANKVDPDRRLEEKTLVQKILQFVGSCEENWVLGKSKVFIRRDAMLLEMQDIQQAMVLRAIGRLRRALEMIRRFVRAWVRSRQARRARRKELERRRAEERRRQEEEQKAKAEAEEKARMEASAEVAQQHQEAQRPSPGGASPVASTASPKARSGGDGDADSRTSAMNWEYQETKRNILPQQRKQTVNRLLSCEVPTAVRSRIATTEPPVKKGWLMKEGGSYKSWKQRYFVLSGGTLSYFKQSKMQGYKGCVHLDSDVMEPCSVTSASYVSATQSDVMLTHGYRMALLTKHRMFVFSAGSIKERASWMKAIDRMIASKNKAAGNVRRSQYGGPRCMKQGVLMKKGHINTNWKQRYFVLNHGRLEYYAARMEWKGGISLLNAKVTQSDKKIRINGILHYHLLIQTESHKLELGVPDEDEAEDWRIVVDQAGDKLARSEDPVVVSGRLARHEYSAKGKGSWSTVMVEIRVGRLDMFRVDDVAENVKSLGSAASFGSSSFKKLGTFKLQGLPDMKSLAAVEQQQREATFQGYLPISHDSFIQLEQPMEDEKLFDPTPLECSVRSSKCSSFTHVFTLESQASRITFAAPGLEELRRWVRALDLVINSAYALPVFLPNNSIKFVRNATSATVAEIIHCVSHEVQ